MDTDNATAHAAAVTAAAQACVDTLRAADPDKGDAAHALTALGANAPAFLDAYATLTDAVRLLDARFAFDRSGRPYAVDAVRAALPAMEREIFEAVLEDFACELAAAQEALRRAVLAGG